MRLVEARRDGALDSTLEVRVWQMLRQRGLPAFTKRRVVRDQDGYVMRLDFAWPAQRVALHADGYRFPHQRERMARDADQRSRLAALGWRSISVMSSTLQPGRWLDQLERALEHSL